MKRFISTLLISALCLFYAAAQETYFPVDSLADLVKCLPAPPETGTPAFKYDIARYKWGKEQRKDVLRAEMAKRDAVWTYEALLAEINPARANEIYARAWAYGESRVIAGAHWQSDVDASRVAASIGFSRLQTSELFHAQMLQAMEEFKEFKK